MQNFTAFNPTKIEFGTNAIQKLADHLAPFKHALLVIGMGSVKKNGVLDAVINQLNWCKIQYTLFEGIKSNPEYQKADEAIQLAKNKSVDCIVAVGGGSVIDTAKAIAIGFFTQESVWNLYLKKSEPPKSALPVFCVLTLAATGTEMNPYSVLQDTADARKYGFGNALLYPKVSFLDPNYTVTVSQAYTAYGIVDLMAHTLEQYFGIDRADLSNHIAASILELALFHGPKAIEEPQNYDARANILWLSTMALNGTLNAGKRGGDWGVHSFEHIFSVLFDLPHGAGLAIVYPAWIRHFQDSIHEKCTFMEMKLNSSIPLADFLEFAFQKMGVPTKLGDWGIKPNQKDEIVAALIKNKVTGVWFKMNETTYSQLLDLMW